MPLYFKYPKWRMPSEQQNCTCTCWFCQIKRHCCEGGTCFSGDHYCPACEVLQDWCNVHKEENEVEPEYTSPFFEESLQEDLRWDRW